MKRDGDKDEEETGAEGAGGLERARRARPKAIPVQRTARVKRSTHARVHNTCCITSFGAPRAFCDRVDAWAMSPLDFVSSGPWHAEHKTQKSERLAGAEAPPIEPEELSREKGRRGIYVTTTDSTNDTICNNDESRVQENTAKSGEEQREQQQARPPARAMPAPAATRRAALLSPACGRGPRRPRAATGPRTRASPARRRGGRRWRRRPGSPGARRRRDSAACRATP